MSQPVSLDSPRVDFRSAVPGARAVGPILLGAASLVILLFGAAASRAQGVGALVTVLLACATWLAGPARSLVDPLVKKLFPPKPGSARASLQGLFVQRGKGQRLWQAHEITEASLYPFAHQLHLRHADGKGIQLHLAAADATALLDALDLPAAKRVQIAHLGLDPRTSRTPWLVAAVAAAITTVVMGVAALAAGSAPSLFALWLVLFAASVSFAATRSIESLGKLAVSPQGVTLQRRGTREHFQHSGLRDVRVEPHRVLLITDNGREIAARTEGLDSAARAAIEAWLQSNRRSFASAAATTDAFAVLERRGRSLDAWREALRTILQQEGQYRRAPINADDLAQLLTNPHAPAERRIAAAFALSQNQSALTQKRIRFAAESSSSQPMRIALRALADERIEESAIEEALAAETGSLAR